ncbi:MAG: efflux RND transporter permease subunit [Thermoplasmata archaeon]
MKIKREKGRFDFFPSFVSENPMKIIVIIVLITLVMGYFASNMSMETEEESFNPESNKAEWLDDIQSEFGTTGEAVQIAFAANDGDVFTKEVLMDMLNTKIKLMENEEVNKTLSSSNNIPEGVNTLADTILMSNQTFEIQNFILNLPDKSSKIKDGINIQKEMFNVINGTFTYGDALIKSAQLGTNQSLMENTTKSLNAVIQITLNPEVWEPLMDYQEQLQSLIEVLQSDAPLKEKIMETEDFIKTLETNPDLVPFKNLFEGMNGILKMPRSQEDPSNAIKMTLTFFQIQHIIQSETMGDIPSIDMPSTSLTLEDKKKKLSNMSDQDIKKDVYKTLTYDREEMRKEVDGSIEKTNSNFTSSINYLDSTLKTLKHLEQTVDQIKNSTNSQSFTVFKQYINSQSTNIYENKSNFSSFNSQISSAENLPKIIGSIRQSLPITISKDFNHLKDISDIKGRSAIGLVQLNSSYSSSTRKEVQYDIIDISKKECINSKPKIFAQQVMMEQINDSANNSLNTLLPLAFLFVVIILLLIYRTVVETAVSLLSLLMAIVWTFGVGVILGYEFNPMIIAVPILITGLVIDYGIHIVMRYREEKDDDKKPKLANMIAISTVGGALLLTTITTAIGFLSNTFSNITVMRNFGILAAVGISSSFILMVGFLPSVLQLVDTWREKRKGSKKKKTDISKKLKKQGEGLINSILSKSTDASDKHPFVVLIVVLIITSSAMYGVVNIDTTFDIQDFLPEDKSQSENIEYINANFNISTSYAYIYTENEVDNPEYLHAVNKTIENTKDDEMVISNGESSTVLSVLQKYGQAQFGSPNYNESIVSLFQNSDKDGDEIPEENVTALYGLLFSFKESKREIQNILYRTDEGSYTKAIIKVKENANKITSNMDNAKVMEDELKEDSKPLKDAGFSTKITSSSIVGQETTEELSNTQINSLMVTVIIVAIILTIVFYYIHKSKVLGVITTLPVTIVTIWIVGTMYIMDVPLNVMTVSITALTVGMGVDYSIHITHRFTEEKEEEDNLYDAMHDTVQNTGAALFGSAVTTIGAFGILSTSKILPLSQFGYITAMAIGYSFLVAVFVLPSGLMIWAKCCKSKEPQKKDIPVLKKKQ